MSEEFCCEMLQEKINDEQVPLIKSKFNEVAVKVLDGGSSYIIFDYCPFCGSKAPASTRPI